MPTYNAVDRFSATVTAAAAQVTPGNTQSVALSSVSGLSSTGKNYLQIFRPVAGREPSYVDTIHDWSGISTLTLTNATRDTGAALQAGDVVVSGFCADLWNTLDADFGGGGYDVVVETAAELLAAFVSGNAGKTIWVKGGTYSVTTQHLRIYSGMHIHWGGGGTGAVTVDFGDNPYYLRSHEDFAYAELAGTSGATATITGSVTPDPDGAGSASFPGSGVTGWRSFVNGHAADYAYASATTFTMSPAPLCDTPNTAGAYYALVTKGAAEDVVMTGNLVVKGTSGSGTGTAEFSCLLVGNRWNTTGCSIEFKQRGYANTAWATQAPMLLCNSQIGPLSFSSDYAWTRTSGGASVTSMFILGGQNTVYQSAKTENISLVNNSAGNTSILRHVIFSLCTNVSINDFTSSRVSIGGTGGTNYHVGVLSGSLSFGSTVKGGRASTWRKTGGTAMTTASDAGNITGQFSTTFGCSLGNFAYTP